MSKKERAIKDEQAVIDCYLEHRSAIVCAEKFGVSNQTIYRILIRNGVERKKPKPEKQTERISNCSTKYCAALVVMLRTVADVKPAEIARIINAHPSSITGIISKRGLQQQKPVRASDIDMDALEAEYLAGASTYELGEKYGVAHQTIGKWMGKRGYFRGKGYGSKKGVEINRERAIERDKQRLLDEGGKIELVEYGGRRSTYRCTDCGLIFTRARGYKQRVVCPDCYEREISEQKAINDARREEKRKQAEQARADEYAKDKICASCGGVFHSEQQRAKFCSKKCRTKDKINKKLIRDREKTALRQLEEAAKYKVCACCGDVFHSIYESKIYCDECAMKHRNCDHRLRAKKYGVAYESGITLEKLIERDGNICQICGEQCDKNDHSWSNGIGSLYPTIDHIIAMANGGGHTWDNVQLAHAICNSVKRDLTEEELTEEVITHAKEQAIADKCA